MKLNVTSESSVPQINKPTMSVTKESSYTVSPTYLLCSGTQTEAPRRRSRRVLYLLAVVGTIALPIILLIAIGQLARLLEPSRIASSSRSSRVYKTDGDDWSRWAAIRNGRLHISETFENRLNREHELLKLLEKRFVGGCKGGDIGFALNRGGGVRGWLEVGMRCGYGTCTRKMRILDIRQLMVERGEDGQFVLANGQKLGPLKGPLRVGLDVSAKLPLRRICEGVVEVVEVGVGEVRDVVGEVDVFRLG